MKIHKTLKGFFLGHCAAQSLTENVAPPLWGWNFGNNSPSPIYDPGIPLPRMHKTIVYSACGNNGQQTGPDVGYACPHMMLFSPDMLLAAKYDGLDENFYYAVGGGGNGDQDCGKCFQVQPVGPETATSDGTDNHQLIIQIVNSGFDVMQGQFDVFMAAGGHGHFNACSNDCRERYCAGGPCVSGQFNSNYDAWNPNTPNCYGGGVRMVGKSATQILDACSKLANGSHAYKDQTLVQSCITSNVKLLHQNFVSTKSVTVQCPDGLSRLTGLRRTDDYNLPLPHVNNPLLTFCQGDVSQHKYCLSSMADCCMPSCAWNDKGAPDQVWNKVDSCKQDGTIYV